MNDHTYRWVSVVLGGKTDFNALRRMAAQPRDEPRWEPVPIDEIPEAIEPPHPDPEKAKNFMLYRMSAVDAARRNADLAFLNDALRDSLVLNAIALEGMRAMAAQRLAMDGKDFEPAAPKELAAAEGNPEFQRKVEVARKFLHERGLA